MRNSFTQIGFKTTFYVDINLNASTCTFEYKKSANKISV